MMSGCSVTACPLCTCTPYEDEPVACEVLSSRSALPTTSFPALSGFGCCPPASFSIWPHFGTTTGSRPTETDAIWSALFSRPSRFQTN